METQHDQEILMTTTTLHPLTSDSQRNATPDRRTSVPAGRVAELLREITIALHSTRVIGRIDERGTRATRTAVPVEA